MEYSKEDNLIISTSKLYLKGSFILFRVSGVILSEATKNLIDRLYEMVCACDGANTHLSIFSKMIMEEDLVEFDKVVVETTNLIGEIEAAFPDMKFDDVF